MPFLIRAGIGFASLKLSDVSFPLCLTRESGEPSHIAFPVEVIDGVTNHEKQIVFNKNLHIKDSHLTLTFNNLRPYMRMGFNVFLN